MKKTLGALLSLSICLNSFFCFADYSENKGTINLDDFSVTGSGILVEGTTVKITEGGDFTVTGISKEGMIYIEANDKVKLRLSGMSLTNDDGPAIWFENTEKALITITENTENFLTDGYEYSEENNAKACLFSNDDLEIKGNGTLTVTANYKHSIASDDDLKIENGTINITAVKDGLKANNDVTISGGTVNITAGSQGIKAEQNIVIDGGKINVLNSEEGFEANLAITFNGGTTNIVAKDDGINSGGSSASDTETANQNIWHGGRFNGQMPEGFVPPEPIEGFIPKDMPHFDKENRPQPGNMIPPEGFTPPDEWQMPQIPQDGRGGMGGFGMMSTTPTDHDIVINGGTLIINAAGDGIDSNGIIIQNGGTVYVNGPENSGNGAIDGNGVLLNGGEMIAVGASGMAMSGSDGSLQGALKLSFATQNAGTKLVLKDSAENTIMEFTPEKRFSSLVYSSEKLTLNETYTLYADDSALVTVTMTALQTSGGTVGGFNRGQRPQGNKNFNNREITVLNNGKKMEFDTNPIINNGTTLVPMRAIFEAFGMDVSWDDETRTVTAKNNSLIITLTVGSETADKNGEKITLNTAPVISNQRTMVPIRFIAESLGLDVSWNGALYQVLINGEVSK